MASIAWPIFDKYLLTQFHSEPHQNVHGPSDCKRKMLLLSGNRHAGLNIRQTLGAVDLLDISYYVGYSLASPSRCYTKRRLNPQDVSRLGA